MGSKTVTKWRCRGITSLLNRDPNSKIKFDEEGHFYEISHDLAEKCTQQTNIPFLLGHIKRYRVGTVQKFSIENRKVNNEDRKVLMADFTIESEPLMKVIRRTWNIRQKDIRAGPKASPVEQDQLAFTIKFPALSLGHNPDNTIEELSAVVAPAREGTLITDLTVEGEVGMDELDTVDEAGNSELDYADLLAACHSVGNGQHISKVQRDLRALDMPPTIMAYALESQPETKNYTTAIATEDVTGQNDKMMPARTERDQGQSDVAQHLAQLANQALEQALTNALKGPLVTPQSSTAVPYVHHPPTYTHHPTTTPTYAHHPMMMGMQPPTRTRKRKHRRVFTREDDEDDDSSYDEDDYDGDDEERLVSILRQVNRKKSARKAPRTSLSGSACRRINFEPQQSSDVDLQETKRQLAEQVEQMGQLQSALTSAASAIAQMQQQAIPQEPKQDGREKQCVQEGQKITSEQAKTVDDKSSQQKYGWQDVDTKKIATSLLNRKVRAKRANVM